MLLNSLLVTLVRHGESQDNHQGIWAGFRDTPLTTNGINQARALGQSFANVPLTAIYCSDLKRAAMTADEILKSNRSIPPPPLVQSKSLREINFGQAEGQSYAHTEWMQGSIGHDARNFRFPEGESLEEVNARIAKAVRQFILPRIEALRRKPPTHSAAVGDVIHICIVAHGIAIAELLRVFMALHDGSASEAWPDPKSSYQRVRLDNTGWSRLELAVPFQSDDEQLAVPAPTFTAESHPNPTASTSQPGPPSSSRPGAQSEYNDFGEIQADLVERPVDATSKMASKPALTPPESAARPVYVRILCQNQTDHLRGFNAQQGSVSSSAKTVAHLAGGGGTPKPSTGSGSASAATMTNQSAMAASAATVGIPPSVTLASISSNATSSNAHPNTSLSPSTPAPGASGSSNGASKNSMTTPASTRSLSSYDARMMARELERAGAASMLAGSEAGSMAGSTGYHASSTCVSALASDRQGSVGGYTVGSGASSTPSGALDRGSFPSSPGVGGSMGAPHTSGAQLGGPYCQGTPGGLAGATSPNPAGVGIPVGPGTWSDTWQMICIRVLPLFNGEALRTSIEELNEMVSLHVRKTLDRGQAHAIESLTLDLMSLTSTGTLTLNSKLQALEDTRLLLRLVEVWTFFLGQVLPYCEACFLPLQTDPTLRSLIAASASYNEAAAGGTGGNGAGPFSSSTNLTQSGAAAILSSAGSVHADLQRIDVRKIVLIVFRDQVLMPIYERLLYLFAHLTELDPSFSASEETSNTAGGGDDGIKQVSLRLLQMTSVLASILSDDEAQDAMDNLLRALRLGSKSASAGRIRGAGEGQGVGGTSPTHKNHRRGWMAQKARKHGAALGLEADGSVFGSTSGLPTFSQMSHDGFGNGTHRPVLTRPSQLTSLRDALGARFGPEMTEDEYLSSLRSPAGSPAISTGGQPEASFTSVVEQKPSRLGADKRAAQMRTADDDSDSTPMAAARNGLAASLDTHEGEPAVATTALAA